MKQDALAWPNSRSQERNSDLKTNRLISRPVQRSCEGGRLSFGRLQTFRARTGLAQSLEGPDSCRMAIRELQVQAVSTGGFSSDNSKALGNRIRIQDRFTSPFIHTGSTFAPLQTTPGSPPLRRAVSRHSSSSVAAAACAGGGLPTATRPT